MHRRSIDDTAPRTMKLFRPAFMRDLPTLVGGLRSGRAPAWPIGLARVLIGLLWLGSLRWKLPPSFDGRGERSIDEWLDLMVEHAAFGFYGEIVERVVIPNATLFSWVLFTIELFTALSLLSGIFSDVAAFLGLMMSLNLLIGLLEVPGEWPWAYVMMAMWHGTFLVLGAGRIWTLEPRFKAALVGTRESNGERHDD